MFNKFIYSLITLYCLFTPIITNADETLNRSYLCPKNVRISIKGGGSFLSNPIHKYFKASILYGADIGYKFNKYFSLGLTFTSRSNYQYSVPNSSLVPGATGDATQSFNSTTFMLEGYYTPFRRGIFSPYLVAGLGMSYNIMEDYNFKNKVSNKIIDLTIIGKGTSNFSWLIGIGTNARLNDSFSIDIGYRYINLGRIISRDIMLIPSKKSYYTSPEVTRGGTAHAHECILGLVYNF